MNQMKTLREALSQFELGNIPMAIEGASGVVRSEDATAQELFVAASILRKCQAPLSDVIGILQRALGQEPHFELASAALFHGFWDAGQFSDAIDEIDRLVTLTGTYYYDDIANGIYEVCEWSPIDENEGGDEDRPGLRSRAARGLKPRYNSSRNPDDQLRQLQRKQSDIRSKGHKGLIDSTEKSKQHLDNELNRIKSVGDAHDSSVTFSREDEESGK